MEYAIWSVEHSSWWRPARFGYTRLKEEAGLYEEEEAFEIVRDANKFGSIDECLVPETLLKRDDVTLLFGIR
jgi:hypothetical protein